MSKTLSDLSEKEFEQMLENMSTPEYDALTAEEFFRILAAMDAADEIHLTGHIEEGRFVFDEPAPLPVNGNVIQLGPKDWRFNNSYKSAPVGLPNPMVMAWIE